MKYSLVKNKWDILTQIVAQRGTYAALATGLRTAPSTMNTTVKKQEKHKEVLPIKLQVPWSKENPPTVTISRTKVCGGHVASRKWSQPRGNLWHIAERKGCTHCHGVWH
jgi:hypothetical protein